ncbi:hypothetical protein PIROE2DRAFT_15877 [Piromyces sp. E2]|nr:hypothetical protein PIROE2DRAFT_15877 [Piromyces sp. E2]|eukprot:OUM58773.1 hypothetical protein PIROE2DRAFT_15877 [Piromyces sp. E2]
MNIKYILLITFLIIKCYCNSHNHYLYELVLLTLAVADKSCIQKSECGPKLSNPNNINSNPIEFDIGKLGNTIVRGTIYDVIPKLRSMSNKDAYEYFAKELFPFAKNVANEIFDIKNLNVDNLDYNNLNSLMDKVDNTLNKFDVLGNLISDDTEESLIRNGYINSNIPNNGKSLFNNGNINDLYIYPIIITSTNNNNLNIFIAEFAKRVRGDDNSKITLPTSNQYDLSKNPDIDSYPNIDVKVVNGLIDACKAEQNCKKIFDKVVNLQSLIYKEIQISIVKSYSNNNNNPVYHLIVNDLKNDRIVRPIVVKNVNGNYERDINYKEKVIYYYNNISLNEDSDFNIDDFTTNIYNKILPYSQPNFLNKIPSNTRDEIMLNPNGSVFYEMYEEIEIIVRDYLENKEINHLTEQQIQRLSSYIFKNSVNLILSNNISFSEINLKNEIKTLLENEQSKFENQCNIDDIDKDLKNKIYRVINNSGLNYESRHNDKFYNREAHFPFSDDRAYFKVDNIDLLVKSEFFLRNRDEAIYIPQISDVDFGNPSQLDNLEGYQYPNSENTFNRRGIAKNLAQNSLTNYAKLNVLDPGKNLNLNTQLEELSNTIQNGELKDIQKSNPNHWLLNHLQNNLGKIYIDSFSLLNKIEIAKRYIELLDEEYEQYKISNVCDANCGKRTTNYKKLIASNLIDIHSILYENINNQNDRSNAKKGKKLKPNVKTNAEKKIVGKLNFRGNRALFENNFNNLKSTADTMEKQYNDIINTCTNIFYKIDSSGIVGLLLNVLANHPLSENEKNYLYEYLKTQNNFFDNDDVTLILSSTSNSDEFLNKDLKSKIQQNLNDKGLKDIIYDKNNINKYNNFICNYSSMDDKENLNLKYNDILELSQNIVNDDGNDINDIHVQYKRYLSYGVAAYLNLEEINSSNLDQTLNLISFNNKHQPSIDKTFSYINNLGVNNRCNRGKISSRKKRALIKRQDSTCQTNANIKYDTDIETLINKNIDILKSFNLEMDESNEHLSNEDSKLKETWNKLIVNFKKSVDSMNKEISNEYITNLNLIMNYFVKSMISSDHINDKRIINFSENDIINMENDYNNVKNIYIEWYNINDIDDDSYYYNLNNANSQSKISKEKLLKSIERLVKLINKNKNTNTDLAIKYIGENLLSEIDHKTIMSDSENLVDAIKKLSEQIDSLDLSNLSNTELKELESINNDLNKLNEAYIHESFSVEKPILNSEITNCLYNSVGSKLGKIERRVYVELNPDNNNLKVPELERLENLDIINIIKDESISIENKKYIFKGLENNVKNSKEQVLDESLYNIINEMKSFIEDKKEQIKSYDSFKEHEREIINFISLLDDYNNLIDATDSNGLIITQGDTSRNSISKIELENNLINYAKTLNNENVSNILDKIAKKLPSDTSNIIQITYDKLALLILAAGNVDGSLTKIINENGKEELLSVNVMNNDETKKLTIKDIIPSLRNLEGKELEDQYYKIYTLSQIAFLEHFSTSVNNDGEFDIDISKIINNHNIVNLLINQNTDSEFEIHDYYFSSDNDFDNIEGEELVTKISYNEDSNSNYHNDKLLDILNKLVKIINMDENSGIGVKINQNTFLNEINPRTIASFDGLNNAIDELCKKINEIDNSRINELRNVIDDIEIIKNTIILELYINGEPSINTEMIIKIYNTLNNKIGNTENINIIESQNELKINIYESNNNDIIESLKSNTISIENKKYIFKGLEYNIVNSKESVLNENMIEILMKIKSFIESKKEQIKSYNSLKGHEQEIVNLINLIENYNNLIDGAISNNKSLEVEGDDNNLNKIEIGNDLINRIKFINNENIVNILDKIAKKLPSDTSNIIQITYDKLALLILAAGNVDGSLTKIINENGKEELLSVNVMNNDETNKLTIKDIIPSLRNLEGKELEDQYYKIYTLSQIAFLEHFSTSVNNDGEFDIDISKIINNHNIVNLLINQNTDSEFEINDYYFSSDNDFDNMFKEFISNNIFDEDIDINNFDGLDISIRNQWNNENINNSEDDKEDLFKAIAFQYAKQSICKQYFIKNENQNNEASNSNDNISFNIIKYESTDNDGNLVNNYSFILNDDNSGTLTHVFTLKDIGDNLYEIDDSKVYNEMSYNSIKLLNIDSNIFNKDFEYDDQYIIKPGIGLYAECGIQFKLSDGTILNPEDYSLGTDDVTDDTIIQDKYGENLESKFCLNVIDSRVLHAMLADNKDTNNNIICSETNPNNLSINEITNNILLNRNVDLDENKYNENSNKLTFEEFLVIDNYNKLILEKLKFPSYKGMLHFSSNEEFNSNFHEFVDTIKLQNSINQINNNQINQCGNSKLRKRATGDNCPMPMTISKNYNIEKSLISSLRIIKIYDTDNILIDTENNDITDSKKLCKNAESTVNVLEIVIDSYQNHIKEISGEESKKFIKGLYETINGFYYKYSKSEYSEDKSLININEEKLQEMEYLFNKALNIHVNNYGEFEINNNKINTIIKPEIESQSLYAQEKLRNILGDIYNFINISENIIDNSLMNFNFDRNKINDDDRTKNSNSLESIIDKENYSNTNPEYVNNSEMVYKLKDSLVEKLESIYSEEDSEIKPLINKHRIKNMGLDKSNVVSTNKLNLNHVIKNIDDIKDFIINNSENLYVKEYFDNLKNKLLNDINENEDNNISDEIINEIKDNASRIKEKITLFNKYDQPDGHHEEALHLIDLINNYDEVISTAVSKANNIDSLERINVNDDDTLYNRLNYLRVNLLYKSLDKIVEDNPKKFSHIKGKVENYVNKEGNGITKFSFGNLDVVDPKVEDFQAVINDIVKTKSDAMVIFTDESTGRYQLINLKRCGKMKYKLVKYEPSFFRNPEDINDLNTLSNINNFLSKIKDKSDTISNIETYEQTKLKNANKVASNYNKISKNKFDKIESMDDAKKLYKEVNSSSENPNINTREEFTNCVKAIKKDMSYSINEIVKVTGKVDENMYNELVTSYKSFKGTTELLNKVNVFNAFNEPMTSHTEVNNILINYNSKVNTVNPHKPIKPITNSHKPVNPIANPNIPIIPKKPYY